MTLHVRWLRSYSRIDAPSRAQWVADPQVRDVAEQAIGSIGLLVPVDGNMIRDGHRPPLSGYTRAGALREHLDSAEVTLYLPDALACPRVGGVGLLEARQMDHVLKGDLGADAYPM